MRRLDVLSERMAHRVGGHDRQKLYVSVMCGCGDEFVTHRETTRARCPTCRAETDILPQESEAEKIRLVAAR
jgi:Zn finger protein HypA/HybF involved in hydrogenase expression